MSDRYNPKGPRDAQPAIHPLASGQSVALARATGGTGRRRCVGQRQRATYWIGRTVAAWMSREAGPPGQRPTGLGVPGALGRQAPQTAPAPCPGRPRGAGSLQKKLRPLLRAVATAYPQAQVELWAVDEHRIGLKPILHKVWCFDGATSHSRRYSTAMTGAIWSASSIPPRAAPSSTWPRRSASPSSRSNWQAFARTVGAGPTEADRARLGSCRLAHQRGSASRSTSICSSCRPTRPNSSRPSTLAANQYRAGQPPLRHHRGPRRGPSRPVSPLQTQPDLIRSTTCFTGGRSASGNDKFTDVTCPPLARYTVGVSQRPGVSGPPR